MCSTSFTVECTYHTKVKGAFDVNLCKSFTWCTSCRCTPSPPPHLSFMVPLDRASVVRSAEHGEPRLLGPPSQEFGALTAPQRVCLWMQGECPGPPRLTAQHEGFAGDQGAIKGTLTIYCFSQNHTHPPSLRGCCSLREEGWVCRRDQARRCMARDKRQSSSQHCSAW